MHSEQLERMAQLIKAQREYAMELKRSPLRTQLTRMWQLLSPLESANLPVLGELQRWFEQGSAACDFALEQVRGARWPAPLPPAAPLCCAAELPRGPHHPFSRASARVPV